MLASLKLMIIAKECLIFGVTSDKRNISSRSVMESPLTGSVLQMLQAFQPS